MANASRRGIIAALMAAANLWRGRVFAQRPADQTIFLLLDLPVEIEDPEQPLYNKNCKIQQGDGNTFTTFVCDPPRKKNIDVMLEVRYKDRVVKLTGDEIMDALEGKHG